MNDDWERWRGEINARLMELAPKYVDVIVRRWQEYTGKEATLDGDERTFDAVADSRRAAGGEGAAAEESDEQVREAVAQ